MDQQEPRDDVAANAIVGMASAAITALYPELGIPVGGAAPYLAKGLAGVFRRSMERQGYVLGRAAEHLEEDPTALITRLLEDPRGEQLFRAAVTAAREATSQEKLEAIARALSAGAATGDDAEVDLEILFLSVAAEIEILHVRVLLAFTQTPNELGLGMAGVSDFDVPVESLNRAQVVMALSHLDRSVDPVLAALVRLGLLAQVDTSAIRPGGPGPAWQITDFGRELLFRLKAMAGDN